MGGPGSGRRPGSGGKSNENKKVEYITERGAIKMVTKEQALKLNTARMKKDKQYIKNKTAKRNSRIGYKD
jgi:hypothetical protein